MSVCRNLYKDYFDNLKAIGYIHRAFFVRGGSGVDLFSVPCEYSDGLSWNWILTLQTHKAKNNVYFNLDSTYKRSFSTWIIFNGNPQKLVDTQPNPASSPLVLFHLQRVWEIAVFKKHKKVINSCTIKWTTICWGYKFLIECV